MNFFVGNLADRFRPYPECKTGIVNLRSGTAFRGVIWRISGPFLVLRNVEMTSDRDNVMRRAVDGEIIVERSQIDFIQVTG